MTETAAAAASLIAFMPGIVPLAELSVAQLCDADHTERVCVIAVSGAERRLRQAFKYTKVPVYTG
ncbi:hypothetical protein MMON_49760 [Mycolicibacterium monacense]|uniref:Uncharacterized protein n=1 Tax=Mycolicibacterium monacense TaxID=85693 RepID=A0AAD1J126_MYCMB|nr:hypothetical protein MMON_49760 [Mycolicibacterium monacense]